MCEPLTQEAEFLKTALDQVIKQNETLLDRVEAAEKLSRYLSGRLRDLILVWNDDNNWDDNTLNGSELEALVEQIEYELNLHRIGP